MCPLGRYQPRLGTVADARPDGSHNGGVFCTFGSSGTGSAQQFVSNASCAYLGAPKSVPKLGLLHVDRRPQQLLAYARTYRASACATGAAAASTPSAHRRIAYLLNPYWMFTGTAVPEAAKALATPVTYVNC